MTRTFWAASGGMVLLALACAALPWPSADGPLAGAQGGKGGGVRKHAQWEYGELLAHQAGAEVAASWVSPKGKVEGGGWKGLLKKLAAREGEGEAVEALNALGAQGWELVAVSVSPIQGPRRAAGEAVTRWTFKRPK
jgi:hypothetical protein